MTTVYKYQLTTRETRVEIQVQMPKGARIISLKVQHGEPCIWAIVDTEAPVEVRTFLVFATGQQIAGNLKHVGSYMICKGAFVFHVFEEVR